MALGSRLIRDVTRAGYDLTWHQNLSITALPSYDIAVTLVSSWLDQYEAYELDGVDVIYNADQGAGTYATAVTRLIPPELPASAGKTMATPQPARSHPVIVETDPMQLYVHIVEQWTSIALYRLLLEAAATEHAARYQLMESATQNADHLVDSLTLTIQSARRQAITRETQELAIGAGLLETS
jgi:F-type H+-transporting ATPase subunit gamma